MIRVCDKSCMPCCTRSDPCTRSCVQILERPHPLFAKIGECYTDCFLPNARNGDSVYLGLLGPSKVRWWLSFSCAEQVFHRQSVRLRMHRRTKVLSENRWLCLTIWAATGARQQRPQGGGSGECPNGTFMTHTSSKKKARKACGGHLRTHFPLLPVCICTT